MFAISSERQLNRGSTAEGTVQRLSRWGLLALALAVVGLVQALGTAIPGVRDLESGLRDAAMALAARTEPDDRIAIVDIDEQSLLTTGKWPWPRERLADLAERLLSDGGAELVVFDLVLTDVESAAGSTGDDRLVAMAMAARLVGSQAFDYAQRPLAMATGRAGGPRAPVHPLPSAAATGFIGNFAALAKAPCIGNIGVVPDPDGRIRRVAPFTSWSAGRYPTLALAALGCRQPAIDTLKLAAKLPIARDGWWAIPFRHRPDAWYSLSAGRVLAGDLPRSPGDRPALAGRIVLVGSSALGLADRVATPVSSNAPGVTVHAAALAALMDLQKESGHQAPADWLLALWAVASTVALWWVLGKGRLRRTAALIAVVIPIWLSLVAWGALSGATASVSAPLWGYATLLLLLMPMEWAWAQARVRSRTRLLSRYVAKPVLDEILARGGDEDPLTPRSASITVLIADMQGYTHLTNHSRLDEVARLTKGFLEQLTEPVRTHLGTLDRYTGDGLVSFWGAPIPVEDHADRAIDAAIAICGNIERFNETRAREGLPKVVVRIGIASGPALVGDLGTPFRIAYTAVGDCINLASRLQQASREVDVGILIADSTAQLCRRHRLRPLGKLPIRGLPDEPIYTT